MEQAPIGQAPANSATSWQSFLGTVQALGVEYFRQKYMDVETPADDRNIPDQADLRYSPSSSSAGSAAGGAPVWVWVAIGVAAVGALLLLRK